jgi:hypothetical protein
VTNANSEHQAEELMSGKRRAARVSLSRTDLSAQIYSFDGKPVIHEEGEYFFRAENLKIISFHDAFYVDWRQRGLKPENMVFTGKVIANCAFSGGERFEKSDRIKRVLFTINEIEELLLNSDIVDTMVDGGNRKIFEINTNEFTLQAWYTFKLSMGSKSPQDVRTTFHVEYTSTVEIGKHLYAMYDILNFFVFVAGRVLTFGQVNVSKISYNDWIGAAEQNSYVEDFEYLFVDENVEETRSISLYHSPYNARNSAETQRLANALQHWLRDSNKLRAARHLMSQCFKQNNLIDGKRLIDACRWLEALPDAKEVAAVGDTQMQKVIDAAYERSEELSLGITKDRFAGAIAKIKGETSRARFERLVEVIWSVKPISNDKAKLISDLVTAYRCRGKAAHKAYHRPSDVSEDSFYRALLALEALCLFFTCSSLISKDLIDHRLFQHRVFEDYRRCK